MTLSSLKSLATWLFGLMIVGFTYFSLQSIVTDLYSSVMNRLIAGFVALAFLLAATDLKTLLRSSLARTILVWSVWIVFSTLFISGGAITAVKMLFWPSAFFSGFLLLRDAPGRILILNALFAVTALLSTVYTHMAREISDMALLLNDLGQASDEFYEAALNIVFYPLLTIPWILTIKKGILRNTLLLIILLSIIVSVKRSALAASAGIVFFYIFYYSRYMHRQRKRIIRLIVPLLVIGAVWFITERYMSDTGEFLVERFQSIEEDKGSGRLVIYDQVMDRLSVNQAEEWLFGHGTNSVIQNIAMHKSAHNDFLEVLFDYGIIGAAIYLCLHLMLIVRLWRLYKNGSQYFVSYLASYIIFFILSMVSHLIIYPTYFAYLSAYWGAMEAMMVNDRRCGDGAARLLSPYDAEMLRAFERNRACGS